MTRHDVSCYNFQHFVSYDICPTEKRVLVLLTCCQHTLPTGQRWARARCYRSFCMRNSLTAGRMSSKAPQFVIVEKPKSRCCH